MTPRRRLRAKLSKLFRNIKNQFSPNQSSRHGAPVRVVVIHTTEGSYRSAVNWFMNPRAEVSSHYVVADVARPGELWTEVTRVVAEPRKAWTGKSVNPYAVQYELAGYSSRSRRQWLVDYRKQLETVAALVADDVLQYKLPIKRDYPGILGHGDLNRHGFPNDHTDPGPNFPWDVFLDRVKYYVGIAQRPEVTRELVVRR